MELQFQKSETDCLRWAVREVQSGEVTQELRLPEGMPDAGRIAGTWGQVILRSKEWQGDQMTASGGVMVWVLYVPEDGSEPRSLDGWIPFQMKWRLPEDCRSGAMRMRPLLRSTDSRTVSPRKLILRAGISILAEAICPEKLELFKPEEVPEDVQLLKVSYPVTLARETGEKTFQLDEELDVGMPKPEKLLSYSADPQLTEQKILADKILWKGTCSVHLLYQCDQGLIHSWDAEVPFSQFQDLGRAFGAEAEADSALAVTSLELEGKETLRLKCGLVCQYVIFDREVLELVQDGYSPCRCVKLQSKALEVPVLLDRCRESIEAEQCLQNPDGELLDLRFLPDFPVSHHRDGCVETELSGVFQYLCCGENNTLQGGSLRWNGSSSIQAGEACRIQGLLTPVSQPQQKGDCRLRQELTLALDSSATEELCMVTGLELGELREPDPGRPSLVLRRCGSGGLWELAKKTGSTVQAIRSANRLEAEPEENRMLLIPVG